MIVLLVLLYQQFVLRLVFDHEAQTESVQGAPLMYHSLRS